MQSFLGHSLISWSVLIYFSKRISLRGYKSYTESKSFIECYLPQEPGHLIESTTTIYLASIDLSKQSAHILQSHFNLKV